MGLARYLFKDRFHLTICALRENGVNEAMPLLDALGVKCFVARFRPRGRRLRRVLDAIRDRGVIRASGTYDIQHSMDFTSSPWEGLFARQHSRTFIFSQRNLNEDGHSCLLRLKARLASRIICVSEAARQLLTKWCPAERLNRIYPGIELDSFPWRAPSRPAGRPFQILMVAAIARRKRLEDGIAAIARLTRDRADVSLSIAGGEADPRYLTELHGFIRSEGIPDRVNFLGPRKDVVDLMRGADVLLHTAGSEAFGMVVIEAMAVGLPVIAPDLQGPKEIIDNERTGFLVSPQDVWSYTAALRRMLENPALGEHVAIQARRRVEEHFSAQRMAEQMSDVYDSVCLSTNRRTA